MILIKMENVCKIYNENSPLEILALNNINLTIEQGDYLSIMGESGSGKTTLLNVLTTAIPNTSGELYLFDKYVNDMSDEEKSALRYQSISFIFQDYNLLNNLTIFENIALPLMMKKEPKEQINEKVENALGHLNISNLKDKFPIECSGGQLQRVSIARAIASGALLLVADEPTGNLDSKNADDFMHLLNDLHKDGMSIILVTHDSKIASHSKRFLYLHDGKIVKEIEKGSRDNKEFFVDITKITMASRRREGSERL